MFIVLPMVAQLQLKLINKTKIYIMKNSNDETFNATIGNTVLGAVKVKDYKCPKCGEIHNDQDDGYEVGEIKFPQYFNESKGSTMDGNYHDWDELHKCENCATEYWFRNGAY